MKITKYVHSCLLVENQGKTVLLDPGNYSVESGALKIENITNLDAIGITHEHMDHMYVPFIKELLVKFPGVQIYSNSSVKDILTKEQINVSTSDNDYLKMINTTHEKIPMGPPPLNVMITLFQKLSHTGDSLSFSGNAEILALPIQAPWGSTTWAVEKALDVKPKVIIPVHDWHWKDDIRVAMYDRLEKYFADYGIIFKKPETGVAIEISID